MELYLVARSKGLPIFLFWPIIWTLVILTFIIARKLPRKFKIISLAILSVGISVIHLVVFPEIYQAGRDSIFEAQFASTIIEKGRWDPTLGTGFAQDYYGHTPVLHFILSFASITTGLNTIIIIKYFLFIIFRLILTLISFIIISIILKYNENSSYLATLIFIGSSGMAFAGVTRRFTAGLFVALALFSILKTKDSSQKMIWNISFMLFSLLVVLADRSVSYYLLIFLAGAWVFHLFLRIAKVKEPNMYPNILPKLIYFIIVFFLWMFRSRRVFFINDYGYLPKLTDIIASRAGMTTFLKVQEAIATTDIYHFYEKFIIYSAQFLFLLLGALGLFFYIKYLLQNKENLTEHKYFLLYFAFFSFIMFIASPFLMQTDLEIAVIIFLWFPCISISIFASYFLEVILRKSIRRIYIYCIMIILVYLFTGSLLMGIYTPRATNRAQGQDIVMELDMRSQTKEMYYSGLWLSQNSEKGDKLLGDVNAYEVYSGFFGFDMHTYTSTLRRLYLGNESDVVGMINQKNFDFGTYKHTLKRDKLDYFIINNGFLKYKSLLFGNPLDEDALKKLDDINLLDKVYNNNEVRIYKLEGGTS